MTVSTRCCGHCGAQPAELLVCSGCDAAFYCTTECQHGAWFDLLRVVFRLFTVYNRLGHKKECRAVQKQRKKREEEEEAKVKPAGPVCDVCGVQSAEVFACPACQLVHYCGLEHQHDAWFVLELFF